MPDAYPDLQVEIDTPDGLLVIDAEWIDANQHWAADYDDFKIILWPESAVPSGVDHNGYLFNRQNERVYDRAYRALIIQARTQVKAHA